VGHFPGASVDAAIHVWDLASGKKIAALRGHEESTNALSFSPDGRLLASCSGNYRSNKDATVRIWDMASARELRRLAGHRGSVNAVAFSSNGQSVVSGSEDGTGLVWDVSDLGVNPNKGPR
jgi:COMPASS component SWD3